MWQETDPCWNAPLPQSAQNTPPFAMANSTQWRSISYPYPAKILMGDLNTSPWSYYFGRLISRTKLADSSGDGASSRLAGQPDLD